MMTCESFHSRFHVATDDAAVLAHLRSCDRCLDHAASIDPDVMFRALGGEDMIPPGGVDAFVDDVMRQVRVRGAESQLAAHSAMSWPRRLAIAATIAAGLTGAVLTSRIDRTAPPAAGVQTATLVQRATPSQKLATKPVVETYDSQNATIFEVPAEEAGDNVKIVMIFDEHLPVDL
jgi:hypothetical protein